MTITLAIGCLVLVFGTAVALGLVIHRLERRKGFISKRSRPLVDSGMSGALGFIGASAAFLLGLLLLSSLNHYQDAESTVDQEAAAYSAAFDTSAGLSAADQVKVQRDLVCLMRSVSTSSWAATQSEDLTGSENTHAWRMRLITDANNAEPSTVAQKNSLDALQTEMIETSTLGQKRLLSAENGLPLALWIVVYVSVFVLTTALTVLLASHPVMAVTALGGILILSAAMVGTLTVFAEPFNKDDGVYISPHSLNAVMIRMQGHYPGAAWEPCEQLAAS